MTDRRREIMVGLVVLLGVAVGVAGAIWLQGGLQPERVQVRAATSNVGHLVAGAAVKFRGVSVGSVEAVAVAPDGEAVLLTLAVDPGIVLPDDAAVVLAPESLFGDWQAEILSRGDFPLPNYYLDHPDPAVLPAAALPDVSRLTATADEIARNLSTISERFEVAFTEETALNLKNAIDNIGRVSDGLSEIIAQQAERFEDLSDGVNVSAAELGAAARQARESFERVDALIADAGVDGLLADAGASMSNLRAVSEDLNVSLGRVREAAERADATFARLDQLLAGVEAGEGSLGTLFGDPALVEGAAEAIQELRSLLADIQEDPRRYLSFSIF